MSRVGLDHIVLVRSIDPNPFHRAQPLPRPQPVPPRPRRRWRRLRRRLLLRSARQRRAPADGVRRTGTRCVVPTTRSWAAGRSSPPWTPDAASTTGSQAVVTHGPALDGTPDRLRRRPQRPGEVVRPGRRPRRRHRPPGRARHLHRGPDPPGLPRRRHRHLADRRFRRTGRRERHGQGAARPSPRSPVATATARRAATRSTSSTCRWATTTRRRRTSSSTRRCTTSCAGSASAASPSSAPPATTPPPARCSRRRSRRGPTARAACRPAGGRRAGGLRRSAQPQRHRRPVQQRRPVGPGAYAPGAAVMSTLPPTFQGGLEPPGPHRGLHAGPRVDRPRRLHGVASRSGAARRSRPRSSPGRLAARAGRPDRPRPRRPRCCGRRAPGRHWRGSPT